MDYALIKEQGITFAVVVVKSQVLTDPSRTEEARRSFSQYFTLGIPIIFMTQNLKGRPKYNGKKDIVKFLSNIDHRHLPWKRKAI